MQPFVQSTINIPGTPSNKALVALNESGRHIYGGTVSAGEKNRRRAANRVAKKSRKANRGKR